MMSGGAVQESPESPATFVWWDIEGCLVPETCDPVDVVDNIRLALKCKGSSDTIWFHVFGRTPIVPWSVQVKLQNAKSVIFDSVGGTERETVTDFIRMRMIKDVGHYPIPPNYLLISGERDFEHALEKLQSRGIHIMLAQPEDISLPLVSNAKCIWLWSTLAVGGPDKTLGQTMASHQSDEKCLDVPHMLFRKLNNRLGQEHSCFTPEEGKTRVVIVVGFEGLGITTTCHNYAKFHKKRGCKAKIVHIDTSGVCTGESHTGSPHLSSAVKRIERYKEKNYDLIVVDTGMSQLSEKMDRLTILKQTREMNAVFKATNPDLVMLVVDSSFEVPALDLVYYFHFQTSCQTGIVIRMSRCHIGCYLTRSIILKQSPVLFIEKGDNMDELCDYMGDFEAADAELLLGMLEWKYLIDKFTLRVIYEKYKKLDQVFCPTHSIQFKSEMGMLKSMTCKEFEGRNPHLILQLVHRIWSSISTCKGCEGNDGTILQHCTTNDNRVSKKQRC